MWSFFNGTFRRLGTSKSSIFDFFFDWVHIFYRGRVSSKNQSLKEAKIFKFFKTLFLLKISFFLDMVPLNIIFWRNKILKFFHM